MDTENAHPRDGLPALTWQRPKKRKNKWSGQRSKYVRPGKVRVKTR
jgi:hypothetical protein